MVRESARGPKLFSAAELGLVTLLFALPFMADTLHAHMIRISSRIIGG